MKENELAYTRKCVECGTSYYYHPRLDPREANSYCSPDCHNKRAEREYLSRYPEHKEG